MARWAPLPWPRRSRGRPPFRRQERRALDRPDRLRAAEEAHEAAVDAAGERGVAASEAVEECARPAACVGVEAAPAEAG